MRKRFSISGIPSVMRGSVYVLAVFAVTLALVLTGLTKTGGNVRKDGLLAAGEAVRRSALCCYALEGAYPESYDYLTEHYPPGISETLYAVHYTAAAPSFMPEITVLRREGMQ